MSRLTLVLSLSIAAGWAAACGSSTKTVTSPSASKCGLSLTATATSFVAGGGSGTLGVTANRDCQWTATATSSWIQLGDAATGQGDGTIAFTVMRNADPAVRKGTITVDDQRIDLTQDAGQCAFTINPRSDSVDATGGQRTLTVTASSPQCSWTARSDVDWIAIVDGAQGTGNGQVRYEARGTNGPGRSGIVTVAGQAITIAQASCAYTLQPGLQDIVQGGGTGRVAVTTSPGCTWTARSTAAWVVLTGSTGTGSGAFSYSVDANAMGVPARTANVTVGDQAFKVNQAAGPACTYALTGNIQWFPRAGAPWSFQVATGAACAWTAVPSASWITLTGSASSTGNGRVVFNVAPNPAPNPERSATIAVGGSIFTVVQTEP